MKKSPDIWLCKKGNGPSYAGREKNVEFIGGYEYDQPSGFTGFTFIAFGNYFRMHGPT